MNMALQINRSEINDKFGHPLSFHLHVSQSKERFWRLAQTNKPAKKHAHRFGEELRRFWWHFRAEKKYANRLNPCSSGTMSYDDGRKRENSSAWKDRITVASTCRRSMEFGCYVTWLWMANCVSVMTKMLPLYNFTITFHGRRACKASQYARASGGSRFRLVESFLFGDHVSLCLHW